VIRVLHAVGRPDPGYIFVAPKGEAAAQPGPMILDNRGQLVWFRPLDTRGVTDLRVQRYQGQPVLTWWRQRPTETGVDPWYTIADTSYRTIAIVRPRGDVIADIHEFLLTSHGTALMTTVRRVTVDGRLVIDGGVQELDLRTNRVLFNWHSVDHVALPESYSKPPRPNVAYDFFHVNSIAVDKDGNLLVSARNTHAVYKLDRHTGRVMWRLGGKRSNFALGRGARFAWQHDARRMPNGLIRIFDNGAAPRWHPQSRVIYLHLSLETKRAQLVGVVVHRPPLVAINQGNAQALPGGHLFIGWGHSPFVTEYDAHGRVVIDLRLAGPLNSYRAFRYQWVGRPTGRPSGAVYRGRIYASWNGATEIARWQLLAGTRITSMRAVRSVRSQGFETSVPAPRHAWIAMRALNSRGRILGVSRPIARH
jgi:Arylsulfotransferase (ASST)